MSEAASPAVLQYLVQRLRALYVLMLAAAQADGMKRLHFTLLNRTAELAPYRRACLFGFGPCGARLLGISGEAVVKRTAPQVQRWHTLFRTLKERNTLQILTAEGRGAEWTAASEAVGGLAVLWLPLSVEGRLVAGLWLERHDGEAWRDDELEMLRALLAGYAAAWRRFARPRSLFASLRRGAVLLFWPLAIGLLLGALVTVRSPLRIVVPCEIVPEQPWLVAAPVAGVIEEVAVEPGDLVRQDDPLFVFDRHEAKEALEIALQQVQIVERQMTRTRRLALSDPESRAELEELTLRLAQEQVRLGAAKRRLALLEVKAPHTGRVMQEERGSWQGRVAGFGEVVMTIVDPDASLVRLWIPEADRILLGESAEVRIVLNIDPRVSYAGRLKRIAPAATPDPEGVLAFEADVLWNDPAPLPPQGLRGHVVLSGAEVPLGYQLFRKPWLSARRFFGW